MPKWRELREAEGGGGLQGTENPIKFLAAFDPRLHLRLPVEVLMWMGKISCESGVLEWYPDFDCHVFQLKDGSTLYFSRCGEKICPILTLQCAEIIADRGGLVTRVLDDSKDNDAIE